MKEQLYTTIDAKISDYRNLSDSIWDFAETAYAETRSAAILADYLEKQGFVVERNVAGIATAFTATYGSGRPHIGFLGEYDALADLAQTAGSTSPDPRNGKAGHGCGHNLLGVGSLAACEAMKSYIDAGHAGSITYYGCPAEEGGSGKAFMARDGVFDDLDAAFTWHPGSTNGVAVASSLANYQVLYRFHGVSAHAAGAPHLGRSALDAVELMNVGVQFLREHIPTSARIHYAITNPGGYSPNVVQAESSVLYLIRMPNVTDLPALYERVNNIAKGAALMTGTEEEHEFIKGCSNTVYSEPLCRTAWNNMKSISIPVPTQSDIAFGTALRAANPNATDGVVYADTISPLADIETAGVGAGSTDIGDVSWICPTLYVYTATWPREVAGHTWQATSCGKSDYAIRATLYAAKILAATAFDMMEDPALLESAKVDHRKRTGGKYICPIPAGIRPRIISQIL